MANDLIRGRFLRGFVVAERQPSAEFSDRPERSIVQRETGYPSPCPRVPPWPCIVKTIHGGSSAGWGERAPVVFAFPALGSVRVRYVIQISRTTRRTPRRSIRPPQPQPHGVGLGVGQVPDRFLAGKERDRWCDWFRFGRGDWLGSRRRRWFREEVRERSRLAHTLDRPQRNPSIAENPVLSSKRHRKIAAFNARISYHIRHGRYRPNQTTPRPD